MKRSPWIAALSVAAIIALGGCSDDSSESATATSAATTSMAAVSLADKIPSPFSAEPQMANTFVGEIQDTDAFIAVVYDGANATAFVCDGSDMWSWLTGSITDGKLALTGADGASLAGTVTDGTLTGTFTGLGLSGNGFEATKATAGEGVYRAVVDLNGEDYTLGWIMTNDGIRGIMRNGAGQTANGLNADDRDDRRDRRERQERQEADRCADLASALARALATQQYLQSQPADGVNPQAIALNANEIQRLQAAQC